jgi:hypothetical protein
MRPVTIVLVGLIAGGLSVPPAFAQTAGGTQSSGEPQQQQPPLPVTPQPVKPQPAGQPKPVIPSRSQKPGVAAFGLFQNEWMTAKDTFDAVFDKSTLSSPGVGAEGYNLFGGLFARIAFSKSTSTGTRVAVVEGESLPLDIGLELKLSSTEVSAGWRVPFGGRRRPGPPPVGKPGAPAPKPVVAGPPRIHAYGGGGFLFVNYRESSTFGESEDNESFNGYLVFGGLDVTIWKLIYAGAEVQYRMVPDALGGGGSSREFNETDLGGVVVRMLFGVRK